jgi:hypothetical protein
MPHCREIVRVIVFIQLVSSSSCNVFSSYNVRRMNVILRTKFHFRTKSIPVLLREFSGFLF